MTPTSTTFNCPSCGAHHVDRAYDWMTRTCMACGHEWHNSPLNYERLLAKYIEHVGAEEGIDFISRLHKGHDGLYMGYSDKVTFTAEEVEALRKVANL